MAREISPAPIGFQYSSVGHLVSESWNRCSMWLWSTPTPAATTWAVSALVSSNRRAPLESGGHEAFS